jgi:hypothetical protein
MRSFLLVALVLSASPVAAQVGYPPAESPYRDVSGKHGMTALLGWFAAGKDPLGLLPQPSLMFGMRYDTDIGGPAQLTLRTQFAPTTRREIDPSRPPATRELGDRTSFVTIADLGVNFNLTGNKSWHGIVPSLLPSVGIMTDFAAEDDGGYSLGTNFAFGVGAGVRYVPGDPTYEFRADIGTLFSQSEYPSSYLASSEGQPAVAPAGTERSGWRRHLTLTLGFTYHLAR